MVLYVAKSSFSQDVAHISFPAEADQVRNEVLAVEEFARLGPRADHRRRRGCASPCRTP